jgi:thiol-disulfide isomerase/thioredoxin
MSAMAASSFRFGAQPLGAALAFAALCGAACARRQEPLKSEPAPPAVAAAAQTAAPPPAASPAHGPVVRQGLPWFEDAPDAAVAEARATGKLLLVDLWAPWCHSCLSMQSFVLTKNNFPSISQRFVLLAIDTERADNAAFLQKLPVTVWPTFYVASPELEVRGRWLGTASPAQFGRFLSESDRSAALQGSDQRPAQDPRAALVAADQLATQGKFLEAAAGYAQALALAPIDWPRRPETLVAQITALTKAKELKRCLELAGSALSQTGASVSSVDFASYALGCADAAPEGDALAARVRREAEARLTRVCEQAQSELTPDDQADACANLAEARTSLGNEAGAREAMLRRLAILERALVGLPDTAAVAYDWALTDTLITLDRAREAVDRAAQRERALPDNYNPPHNQAKGYKALGLWAEGLSALKRAQQLAYGPRRISFGTLEADLLIGAGRKQEARQVVTDQLAQYRALPAPQRQPAQEARIEKRLADWH